MKTTFSDELINAAVEFWVKTLDPDPEVAATPQDDRAQLRLHLDKPAFAGLFERVRQLCKPTPEQVEIFRVELRKLLREPELVYCVFSDSHVELRTDYDPDGLLRIAAERAGIDGKAFPFKTWLSLRHGKAVSGTTVVYEEELPAKRKFNPDWPPRDSREVTIANGDVVFLAEGESWRLVKDRDNKTGGLSGQLLTNEERVKVMQKLMADCNAGTFAKVSITTLTEEEHFAQLEQ